MRGRSSKDNGGGQDRQPFDPTRRHIGGLILADAVTAVHLLERSGVIEMAQGMTCSHRLEMNKLLLPVDHLQGAD